MNIEKMREDFELAMVTELNKEASPSDQVTIKEMRAQRKGSSYRANINQAAWWAWQASREALVIELPQIVGYEAAYDSFKGHELVSLMSDVDDADEIFGLCRSIEVIEAIEAAGLKVKA